LICIPVPLAPGNTTNAMFNALDEFLMKMKDANKCFMVFLHNLPQYGTLASLPQLIEQPEDLPTEVNKWPV